MQTFLVRIWRPDPSAPMPAAGLRGVVESLAARTVTPFRSPEELIGCIVLALGVGDEGQRGGPAHADADEPPEGASP